MPENSNADEVVITDPDGQVLPDDEAQEFLKRIQAGVFYIPQDR